MPSRVQLQITESEERKRRQEKFRKRSRSIFNKVKLLAKDTDAWVSLVVRDRAGRIQSFRSSDRPYWPPSIIELIKTHPSGTHEFLQKHVVSGCWKEATEDESDSVSVDAITDAFVQYVGVMRATPAEMEAGSESSITVDPCQGGKQVETETSAPTDTAIETVENQRSAIDVRGELDSTLLEGLRESDGMIVDTHGESYYTHINVPGESDNPRDDSVGEPSATLASHGEPDGVELGKLDNMIIDTVRESSNTALDVPVESDNASVQLLDEARDVPGEAMAMDVHASEVDPTSEYDMVDLDVPRVKSSVGIEGREHQSTEEASALYAMSQYHSPPSSGGLDSWQVVNWPGVTLQEGRQARGLKPSKTRIDPKDLLEGWEWVFQKVDPAGRRYSRDTAATVGLR